LRLVEIQTVAQRLFAQIPDEKLNRTLPHRPRSYAQLAYHIFNIADAFLEHEVQDLPLKEGAYDRLPPPEMNTKAKILAYGQNVLVARFSQIEGYRCLSLMRAFLVVKCQSDLV
jgi:hypothetical protein